MVRGSLRTGDVFEMTLEQGALGYGVAVIGGGTPFIIVLRKLHRHRAVEAELESDDIAFVGWTMDALVLHGRWNVILSDFGERSDIPYPNCKIGMRGQTFATDFSGTVLGLATPEEEALLDFKTSRSPIAYQQALEALHGLRPWHHDYESMTLAYAQKRCTRSGSVRH